MALTRGRRRRQPQLAIRPLPSLGFTSFLLPTARLDLVRSVAPTFAGSAGYTTSPGGRAYSQASGTNSITAGLDSAVLSLQGATVIIAGWANTPGANGQFGEQAGATARCGAHIPFSGDSKVYWDFGGSTEGTTRLSVAGLSFADSDVWGFTTGPRGMEIWQNGVLRASNAANPTRADAGGNWGLTGNGNTGTDAGTWYALAFRPSQMTTAQMRALTRDLWGTAFPRTRRIWPGFTAGAAGASTITTAAGVATTSTLTGSSTAASTLTAAAGVATDSTLTGKSTAAATLTAAAGVATDSTLTGSSAAAATVTAAAGVATTSTLSSGSASGITAAAGVATTSTLTGSSVAAATVTAAAGVATGSTLTGSVGAPIITPAAGVATGGTLAGSSVAVASIVAAAGVATSATVSTIPPAGSTGAVILLPIRLISGVYTTTGVVAGRALQNLRAALPNRNVPLVSPDGTMHPQWYRWNQMFVDVFIGSAAAYTLSDIINSVVTSQANATQQALTTSAIAQQLQGVAEATAVVKQVAVTNSLSGADQIPDVPLSYGMEP